MSEEIRPESMNDIRKERQARIKLGSSQSIGPAASHRVKAALHLHSADIIDDLDEGKYLTATGALSLIDDCKNATKGINPSTTWEELEERLDKYDIPSEALDIHSLRMNS